MMTPPLFTNQGEETASIKQHVSECEQNIERKSKIQVVYVSSEMDQ